MYDLPKKTLQQNLIDQNKLSSNEDLLKTYSASGFHMMADSGACPKHSSMTCMPYNYA
ncbi:hypothetical protein SAMN05421784_1652 [Xenorhabdus koppenhoeferi]|uniref:Uncharacterized protein n=1 Tax=Xenorhabdus koppenhoeferi TaxID=351659 RepID=A0A1I7KIJ3_9GAMM|nr:hypothetical protein SAMN05421784_1652 [Xenorhabdus koppenhoeferi]